MAISLIYTGQPMTGTAGDDFIIAYAGSTGTSANTINAGAGNDWVMGDSPNVYIPATSISNGTIATAFSLDGTAQWTTGENPLVENSNIPHVTAIVEATPGQSEVFAVTVGAGRTITIDIDFSYNSPIGGPRDLVVELKDSAGTILATGDDSQITDGGLGSFPLQTGQTQSRDPYLTYTVAAAGTYYINVRPYGEGPTGTFSEPDIFVMNVSVPGHAVGTNAVGGADIINGGDGDDFLFGQGGDDVIEGGAGNDLIHGGSGFDIINGGPGNDTIYGGDGTDELVHGNDGNDTLISGGEGHYYGDAGDDLIFAGLSNGLPEVLDGGSGIDTLDTTSYGGDYTINMVTGVTNFAYESFVNFENIVTGAGNDRVTGTSGVNIIKTGAGNDVLIGGAGADRMEGGTGNDDYYVDNVGDQVIEAAGQGNDRVFTSVSYTLAAGQHIERLATTNQAGTAALNLTGNDFAQTIIGNSGANIINGRGGADVMHGNGGNDTYYVDNAFDVIGGESAGNGTDDRVFASVSYTLTAGQHIERLATTSQAGTAAINLTGNDLAQLIIGNAGANILDGRGGADTMYGHGGDDDYYVDNPGDVIGSESAGNGALDRVFTSVSYVLAAGQYIERMHTTDQAGTAAINLTGNDLVQTLIGNAGDNIINGRGGADTMFGYGGNDTYYVDNANDVIGSESAGNGAFDQVFTSVTYVLAAGQYIERMATTSTGGTTALNLVGNDIGQTIVGNAGANIIRGMGGNDTLIGGSGNDRLLGGAGNDILNGGAGNDIFIFDAALNAATNIDTIQDYNVAQDSIWLEDAVFTGLTLGALAASAFTTGAAATTANHRIIYNAATGALSFDADGNGGGAAIQFASLAAGLAMNAGEFTVI